MPSQFASGSRRPVRTSISHPLRIDVVPAGAGSIGITFCPGKKGPSTAGYDWDRDLDLDLDVVAAWKPAAVVTLIEDHEFRMLGVPQLADGIRKRGLEWHHLPIVDVQPPDERFEAAWADVGPRLVALLRSGQRVLVHCRGGLGRAGTVSALLLARLGVEGTEAVSRVRRARRGAIETAAQEKYVLRVARELHRRPADWFETLTGFAETPGQMVLKRPANALRSTEHVSDHW